MTINLFLFTWIMTGIIYAAKIRLVVSVFKLLDRALLLTFFQFEHGVKPLHPLLRSEPIIKIQISTND